MESRKLIAPEDNSLTKFKKKVTMGLEALMTHVADNPEAAQAFADFYEGVKGPFDDMPGGPDNLKKDGC